MNKAAAAKNTSAWGMVCIGVDGINALPRLALPQYESTEYPAVIYVKYVSAANKL